MIYRSAANCRHCKNYLGEQKCRAFPEGIPEPLNAGEHLHREPYPGDQGILFEAKIIGLPDAEAFLSGKY